MKQIQRKKVFVSHADADAPAIKAFVTLMEAGIGVSPKAIFCTSIKSQGIKPGVDFKSSIHENLGNATTVVALISENYYNSSFCMCELGGVWLQSKEFIPILFPPVRFSDMKAVLVGLQALCLDSAQDLDELRDEIAQRLGIEPLPTPRWNEKRDDFLKGLAENIKKIPPSPTIPRIQLENAKKESSEYKALLKEAQVEIQKLKTLISKLKKAKDEEAVSIIIEEDMDAIEFFKSLCTNIKGSLNKLEAITCEAIFLSCLREDLILDQHSDYSWYEARKPMQYKEITINSNENGVCPNDNHVKVKKALSSISKLENWLENDASSDFYEWYGSKYDGTSPDLTDRTFWDNHLW